MKSIDWQRVWRGAGIQAVLFFALAYLVRGGQPEIGTSPESLASFYDGDSTRILIATVVFGFAILCLLWFAAAVTSVLRDAGKGGWGSAVTAASTAIGAVYFSLITVRAALAYPPGPSRRA